MAETVFVQYSVDIIFELLRFRFRKPKAKLASPP